MNIIVFDTETTGLPLPNSAPLAAQPHIIEFYGVKVDEEFNIISEFNHLIKPPIQISDKITKINGITNEMVEDKPTFGKIADELIDFFFNTDFSVAHNHSFDETMMTLELRRLELDHKFPWARKQICTVESSFHLRGRRLPLGQLHQLLLNKPFSKGAHRAKNDVFALVRCFHAMIEQKVIRL